VDSIDIDVRRQDLHDPHPQVHEQQASVPQAIRTYLSSSESKQHVHHRRAVKTDGVCVVQVVDVIHPGRASVPKAELSAKMAKMYKIADEKLVMVYGFKTAFGGGKSTGFGLIYDNMKALQAYEPRYRLSRIGLFKKPETSRKQRKERKNKAACVIGIKKAEILRGTGKK